MRIGHRWLCTVAIRRTFWRDSRYQRPYDPPVPDVTLTNEELRDICMALRARGRSA